MHVANSQPYFGRNEAPCESTVRRLMTKFETNDSVLTLNRLGGNEETGVTKQAPAF